MDKKLLIKMYIDVSHDELAMIDKKAKILGVSHSDFLNIALENYLSPNDAPFLTELARQTEILSKSLKKIDVTLKYIEKSNARIEKMEMDAGNKNV